MNKYIMVLIMSLGLLSCATKDEAYYRTHPKALQEALKTCPDQQPAQVSCQQLQDMGKILNTLVYQLQSNPQAFGSKIIKLQQTIISQENELNLNKTDEDLAANLERNRQKLADSMVIVKWLESPES